MSDENAEADSLQTWRRRAVSFEAAAFTGALFAALYSLSLVLIGSGLPDWSGTSQEVASSLADTDNASAVRAGYAMTPFAAIVFLWFVAVLYRRIPPTDRFVTIVFIAGSTLFVALYLVATTAVGGPYRVEDAKGIKVLEPATLRTLQSVAWTLLFVVAVRIQVLVILAATAAGRRHGVLPRWLTRFGYLVAVVQVLNFTLFEPLIFLFPLWVLAVSLTIAFRRDALPG